jgi:signal transduction histidine kinase
MTPLSVSVATLQERLRAAPAGEVEMVIAEIEASSSDPARRADLEQFLRLVSRELAGTVAQAADEVAAITRQAQVIQAALAQQLQASRSGPVVETVELTALVEQSLDMIPPALLQRLSIEIDGSLVAAGALPLPRITLQQVFQNVVQNAAEAVREPGRARGRLSVSCRTETAPNGVEWLQVRFDDDGVGIRPSDLPRIFDKGFSTKPRESNHGIGLHWCANALNALGGRLEATSVAEGGATFTVWLPLRNVPAPAREAA